MKQIQLRFAHGSSRLLLPASLTELKQLPEATKFVVITDEHIAAHYESQLRHWPLIVLPPGESTKCMETIMSLMQQLIDMEINRDGFLVGIGGGVITDITGFAAGIYKRGIRCGFVPTSVLAMADAAIGGKNGINLNPYKNMIGLVRQPEFVYYDFALLRTLPRQEWINGFAEIIKHACIRDEALFTLLETQQIADFQRDPALLQHIMERNVMIKGDIVQGDETEEGSRKLLNFGHTLAHAIENDYQLPHGHAVAVGIYFAAKLSEKKNGFSGAARIKALLERYQLPTQFPYDPQKVWRHLLADKKRVGTTIDFILLRAIGEAYRQHLPLSEIEQQLKL